LVSVTTKTEITVRALEHGGGGMAITSSELGSRTATLTNMPGRSFSSPFVSVAWSWTLRVSASTSGFTAVMRPPRHPWQKSQ